MAESSSTYRVAHACFACRRSFKIADDLTKPPRQNKCPQCKGSLSWMGCSFTAPRKTDTGAWRAVEALWQSGFRFASYRSHKDAEPLPRKFKGVAAFIRRNPRPHQVTTSPSNETSHQATHIPHNRRTAGLSPGPPPFPPHGTTVTGMVAVLLNSRDSVTAPSESAVSPSR
jgi:hypothetical protein